CPAGTASRSWSEHPEEPRRPAPGPRSRDGFARGRPPARYGERPRSRPRFCNRGATSPRESRWSDAAQAAEIAHVARSSRSRASWAGVVVYHGDRTRFRPPAPAAGRSALLDGPLDPLHQGPEDRPLVEHPAAAGDVARREAPEERGDREVGPAHLVGVEE